MVDLRQRTTEYLAAFSAADLSALEGFFAEGVTLRDWELDLKGRAQVLEANRKMFSGPGRITAHPLRIYIDGQTAIAELSIEVDGKFALFVTDILEFDREGRITALRAYRGN